MDPMEKIIREALSDADIRFVCDGEGETKKLDFYLPDDDLYIEVKRFHSDRIGEQMSRAENVIAIQGMKAAEFFARAFAESA